MQDSVQDIAWEERILRNFLDGERLKAPPASRRKRLVVLTWLVGKYEVGVR